MLEQLTEEDKVCYYCKEIIDKRYRVGGSVCITFINIYQIPQIKLFCSKECREEYMKKVKEEMSND